MPPLLILLFVAVPVAELWVILQVSDRIGLGWTVLSLLLVSVVGATLVKREGMRAWQRFRAAMGEARLPAVEVTDGALVLLGGALMLTPGFLTDVVGLLLVVPFSRAAVNRLVRRRFRGAIGLGVLGGPSPRRRPPRHDDEVVDVEVVDVRRDDDEPGGDELERG